MRGVEIFAHGLAFHVQVLGNCTQAPPALMQLLDRIIACLSLRLALLALLLWPIVWLISLPFRLVGITFEAVFALLRAILSLPARVLGGRRNLHGRMRPDSR